jgi:hypothetical protein
MSPQVRRAAPLRAARKSAATTATDTAILPRDQRPRVDVWSCSHVVLTNREAAELLARAVGA